MNNFEKHCTVFSVAQNFISKVSSNYQVEKFNAILCLPAQLNSQNCLCLCYLQVYFLCSQVIVCNDHLQLELKTEVVPDIWLICC